MAADQFRPHQYLFQNMDTAHHLFEVAAGLDSLVIGEPQILGQVTRALELARGQNTAGSILNRLFQAAIHTGKRTRTAFNISHTHSLIVLGVTRHRALGVDIENFAAREVSIDIADRFFSRDEVAALAAIPPHRQQYRFFEYWTFKESYIKARGMGLSLPLDKFSFRYHHERAVEIAIHPELGDEPARWQFWQLRPASQYLLAVCAEHIGGQGARLVVRETVPLMREETVTHEVLRSSAGAVPCGARGSSPPA